jgi:hypothetical protein
LEPPPPDGQRLLLMLGQESAQREFAVILNWQESS